MPILLNPYRFGSAAAGPYDTEVMADSPSLFLKLDETSGTSAADSSGNGRTGTHTGGVLVGQPSLLTSGVGKSCTYDGVNDTTSVPYGAWMNQPSFTVEVIIEYTAGSSYVATRWTGSSSRVWMLIANASGLTFTFQTSINQQSFTGAFSFVVGQIYTLTITRDNSVSPARFTAYVDGAQVATMTHGNPLNAPGAGPIEIARAAAAAAFSTAKATRLSFTPTALSAARVATRHAARIAP